MHCKQPRPSWRSNARNSHGVCNLRRECGYDSPTGMPVKYVESVCRLLLLEIVKFLTNSVLTSGDSISSFCFCLRQTDLEEAKAQEIAKLQASVLELQAEVEASKALLIKERETAKQVIVAAPKEVPVIVENGPKMEKLMQENEKLRVSPFSDGFEALYGSPIRRKVVLQHPPVPYLSVMSRPCSLFRVWYQRWRKRQQNKERIC